MSTEPSFLPSAPSAARSNSFERIAGLFTAPAATMKAIVEKPDWLIPLLLIVVLTGAASFAAAPKVDAEPEIRPAVEKMAKERDLPPQVVEEQIEMQARMGRIAFQWAWVAIPLLIAISAGLLLFAFNIFGGNINFRQSMAIVCYAWIPLTIRGLVASGVVAMREDDTTPTGMIGASYTNPSFLFDVETQRALAIAVSPFDILGIFALYLMIIGFSMGSGLSKKASAILVIGLWSLTFLARLVPALLS